MKMNKFSLLAAAAAGAFGTAAQAQELFPAAVLRGNGASLPANVQRQAADCYGIKGPLGFQGATTPLVTIQDFDFDTPAADSLGNRFNCAGNAAAPAIAAGPLGSPQFANPRIIQPQIEAIYLSTGSGAGVRAFLQHIRPEAAVGNSVALPAGFASYGDNAVQYALSETALSFANLNGTNATPAGYNFASLPPQNTNDGAVVVPAGTALARYGAAIQIPIYVAPVAVMYDPVYAKERNGGDFINQFRFTIGAARSDGSGGLRLTKAEYCGIFTGLITNWNQLSPADVTRDTNDTVGTFNVPMQIVARQEGSGTTSLFTRALSAQCTGAVVNINTGGNGVPVAQQVTRTIIANGTPPADASQVANPYANSTDTIPAGLRNGAVFTKGSSPSFTTTPAPTPGSFVVADGSDGVSQAVDFHVDPLPGTFNTPAGRTINGKIGYVAPDYTLPATIYTGTNDYGLHTASLQKGTGGLFAAPTSTEATAAFSTVRPPQSKLAGGAYCVTGDPTACNTTGGQPGNRANPLDWVYPANKFLLQTSGLNAGQPLLDNQTPQQPIPSPIANPTAGYPIVGTSNVLLYTCYFTPELRIATNGLWSTFLGATTKDYNNQAVSIALLTDPVRSVLARNGLAAMPLGWRNAIRETFFKSSLQTSNGQVLGAQNLWIQSRIPTLPSTTAGAATANQLKNATANPTCANTGRVGA